MSRVAVLKGGHSLERQVSLKSSARVEDSLERLGHAVVSIDVEADLVDRLADARPDMAFIAMHGRDGEDGTVQELLELVGVPYTGSGPFACLRTWDKVLTKHTLVDAGIATPPFYAFNETAFRELGAAHALPAIEQRLDFPIVVKPARQGSALGVKFAQRPHEVPGALLAAFSYDTKVLLERHVDGRDLAVSVLGGPEGIVALPVVEAIAHPEDDFYDFVARYEIGRTTFTCPAELSPAVTGRAQEIAVAAYQLLGCHGFARVDMMLDADTSELFVIDINAIPGLTETSLLPQAADAGGIGFDELIGRMLDSALTRTGMAPSAG